MNNETERRDDSVEIAAVVPTYLHSVYLRTCVLSIVNQTTPCKIVVVPVLSDKPTLDVLENLYAEVFNLGREMKVVPSEIADPFKQMQLGLDNVDTEYMFFLGSDDTILPNMAGRMIEVAERSRCQNPIVALSPMMTDENLNPLMPKPLRRFNPSTFMRRSMIPDNALVRTEMLRKAGGLLNGGKDWGYLNHYALWLRMLRIPDTKVELLPEVGWLYRQTGNNRSLRRYDSRKKLREHHRRQRELVRFYYPDVSRIARSLHL